MINTLLLYPKNPISMWTLDESLMIADKDASFIPTGLLTIAGLLPEKYNLRLIDENVTELKDKDFDWADVALVTGMIIHRKPQEKIIKRANEHRKPLIIGGQYATQYSDKIKGYGTIYRGEAESAILDVLEDIVEKGYREETRIIDKSKDFVSVDKIPLQRFDLIRENMKKYGVMSVQITRGCPESCTFCDIPILTGKKSRIRHTNDVLAELNSLYDMGWRGSVMLVDDNFVGNQVGIMNILKKIEPWQKERGYPFTFFTQATLRMYENKELMEAMYKAGFDTVFFGIESPSKESLKFMAAQKNLQNKEGKSMSEKLRDIQANYFKAQAGFILGLDMDPDNIDDLMKQFIQESRIGVAMVGPLGVVPGTSLHKRFLREGRLVDDVVYDGGSGIFSRELSYKPKNNKGEFMDPMIVINRHKNVLKYINSPEVYFKRTMAYLENRQRMPLARKKLSKDRIKAFLRSVYYQGIKSNYKKEYWRYLYNAAKHDMTSKEQSIFSDAVTFAIHGHHLITTTQESIKAEEVNADLERLIGKVEHISDNILNASKDYLHDIVGKYKDVREDFREIVKKEYRKVLENFAYRQKFDCLNDFAKE